MTTTLIIAIISANVIIKTSLLLFVKKVVKQPKTKLFSKIYIILFSPIVANLMCIFSYRDMDFSFIFFVLISFIIDMAVLQWFRAFWEKDKDTKDLDYNSDLTNF